MPTNVMSIPIRRMRPPCCARAPIQRPIKFDLVINLKAAKALGIDVPALLQQRADEVIE